MNIIVPPGILGAITVPGSGVGVTVNAGSLDIVRIQGVHINTGGVSTTGLRTQGLCCKRLELKDVDIDGLVTGVDLPVDTRMVADSLRISDFTTGIWLHGAGTASTGTMKVAFTNLVMYGGNTGAKVDEGAMYSTNGTGFYISVPFLFANETLVSGCTTAPFTTSTYCGSGTDNRNGMMLNYTLCASP